MPERHVLYIIRNEVRGSYMNDIIFVFRVMAAHSSLEAGLANESID